MRRLIASVLYVAGTALLVAGLAHAQLPLTHGGKGAPGGATYTGPGDVVSGAAAWWGLRCYNTAYTGNVADVYAPSDGSHTLITCSTGGVLNETLQALSTTCATSCTVKTLYDQSGQTNCGGAACNVSNATEAVRPAFITNCQGGHPCFRCTQAASSVLSTAAGATINQAFTISYVANRTGGSSYSSVFSSGVVNAGFDAGGNALFIYVGASIPTASATDNSFHAVQNIFNNASSDIYVDGSANASDLGSSTGISTTMGLCGVGFNLTGDVTEVGVWGSAFSSGNKSAMNSNQHAYWSF